MIAMTLGAGAMEPEEIEGLLPWHATGTLNPRDARRVDEALARDPQLARQYAVIQDEIAETIHVIESLGAPSSRAMRRLLAPIDGEPSRAVRRSSNVIAQIADFIISLSPRTLAYSVALGAIELLLQAAVIAAVVTAKPTPGYEIASSDGLGLGTRALVGFQANAKLADITQFLDAHNASIIGGPKAGM